MSCRCCAAGACWPEPPDPARRPAPPTVIQLADGEAGGQVGGRIRRPRRRRWWRRPPSPSPPRSSSAGRRGRAGTSGCATGRARARPVEALELADRAGGGAVPLVDVELRDFVAGARPALVTVTETVTASPGGCGRGPRSGRRLEPAIRQSIAERVQRRALLVPVTPSLVRGVVRDRVAVERAGPGRRSAAR